MYINRLYSLLDAFRAEPAASSLLLLGPLTLAGGQLLNAYFNGVSPTVSVAFAAVMVAFAVVATRHHAAEHRLRQLERDITLDADRESDVEPTG